MAFKDLFKTKAERRAYAIGRKHERKSCIAKKKKSSNLASKKRFGFLAFNDNCDVFNVYAEGYSSADALKNAKKHLKRDPERPFWGVEITNDNANSDYYRKVSIDSNGSIIDSWRPHYRREDDAARRKYKDLSKPVK